MPLPLTAVSFARYSVASRMALEHGRLRRLPQGPSDRRLRAARIARLLAPAAEAGGGFTTCEVVVRAARNPDSARRPDCCVVLGDPPADGVLDRPPLLVVEFAPAGEPAWYLALGTAAVWLVAGSQVSVHLGSGQAGHLDAGGRASVPGHPRLALPVADLVDES
jgi:hypothetical protein